MKNKNYFLKALSLIIAVSFLLIPLPVSASGQYLLGDVNGDSDITAADALLALQHSVKKITLKDNAFSAADVDGKSDVSASDALLILQYSVGKIKKFPASVEPGASNVEWLEGASGYASTSESYIPDEGEITTLYQCNMGYSSSYALETDCVLAYVYGKTIGSSDILDTWKNAATEMYNGDTTVGIMVPANRDNAEYLETYTERGTKDIQTKSDGTFIQHSTMNNKSIYYMVPTESYAQYKWEVIESYLKLGCKVVAIEEPEMWNVAGYSEGFKEEWKNYYGTDWVDEESSADAMYKSQQLKAYLFEREIKYISDNIKEKYPDTTVLIATHSVANYSKHGISTGISMYANIDSVDGIIGQTWSDGVIMSVPYAGENSVNTFATAMYEYNSYGEFLPEGKSLYLLQDPASDNPSLTAEQYEKNWKMTVVASLMQQDTDFSQFTIWPQRAYLPMGMNYKIIQQSVYKLYNQLAGKGSTVYSGTKGVCLGLSDSASWNIGSSNTTTGNCLNTIYGVSLSLIYDGVPVDTVCLDTLTSVDQLSGVNLLILSYDSMKPLSEDVNDVIAQWVKDGGRLLYLGGYDSFTDISDQWWSEKNTTPLGDLFSSLGLSDIKINKGVDRGTVPVWSGSSIASTDSLGSVYANNTYTFEGSGFETFMTAGGKNTGITAECEKGEIVCVGLPSATYSKSYSMELTLRQLAALALKDSPNEYSSSEFYTMTSGNYMSYFNWYSVKNTAADKTYIDIFNADLPIIKGGSSLLRNTPILYYDISSLIGAGTPKLAFTNGVETEDATETASATTFTVASPTSSVFASVLLGNGKYPQSVSAVTKSGLKCSLITTWDDENKSLLVKCTSNDLLDPVTVTVEWGDTYVKLDTNYEYKSYFHATQDKTIADDIFLNDYNCYINDGVYFCDIDTYCIWKIDLNDYKDASMLMDILSNYVVSVSFDGENWTVVEDYSKIGEFETHGANRKTLVVASTNYSEAIGADAMYIKLSSCYMDTATNPAKGWGGTIISYSVNYLAPVE